MKDEKEKNKEMQGEDSTKYGEFISSYFAWLSLDQQKEISDKLSNITKEDKE